MGSVDTSTASYTGIEGRQEICKEQKAVYDRIDSLNVNEIVNGRA